MRKAITLFNRFWALADHAEEDEQNECDDNGGDVNETSMPDVSFEPEAYHFFDWDELDVIYEKSEMAGRINESEAYHFFDWEELDATYEKNELADQVNESEAYHYFDWGALDAFYEKDEVADEVYEGCGLSAPFEAERMAYGKMDEKDAPFEAEHMFHVRKDEDEYDFLGWEGASVEDGVEEGGSKEYAMFDWEALGRAEHEELARKVRELVMKMKLMRSKGFMRAQKKEWKMRRYNHKRMQRIRKQGKGMDEHFDWDLLEAAYEKHEATKAAQAIQEHLFFDWDGLDAVYEAGVGGGPDTCQFFDWDCLEEAWEEHTRREIRKMKQEFTRSTGSVNIETMREEEEIRMNRKVKRAQRMKAVMKMKEMRQDKLKQARCQNHCNVSK